MQKQNKNKTKKKQKNNKFDANQGIFLYLKANYV